MKNLLENIKKLPFIPTVFLITLLAMSAFAYYHYASYINLKLAWKGCGPQDYVAQKLYPENFTKDFHSGIMVYDSSILMRMFPAAEKYLSLDTSALLHPYMFFHTLLFGLAVYFLAFALFSNHFVSFMSAAVCLVGYIPGANLSKFGTGFWSYLTFALFYAYANALRIFSIGMFVKKRYFFSFALLALTLYCHFTMGLFVLCAYGVYFLFNLKQLKDKKLLLSIGAFALTVLPLFLQTFFSAVNDKPGIPVEDWIKYTKMLSCHWYPGLLQIFSRGAKYEFFSLVGILAFWFFTTRFIDIKENRHKAIFIFTASWLAMSAVGIAVTMLHPVQALVILCLQRSTSLVTFLGTLYLVNYIYGKIKTGGIIGIFAAFWVLGCLFFSYPGLAAGPCLVMFATDLKNKQLGFTKAWSKPFIAALSYFCLLAAVCVFYAVMASIFNQAKDCFAWPFARKMLVSTWYPFLFFDPWSLHDYFLRGGMFRVHPFLLKFTVATAVSTVLALGARKFTNHIWRKTLVVVLAGCTFASVWFLSNQSYAIWKGRKEPVAKDYLDVQLWAKNNTAKDALFMPDPAHFYGWRDFSRRSSFGNLREWVHTCMVYFPKNIEGCNSGIERLKDFTGYDLREMKIPEAGASGRTLNRIAKKRHYNISAAERTAFADKYSIDYFILEKAYITPQNYLDSLSQFEVAYQNGSYMVLKKGQTAVSPKAGIDLENFKGPLTGPVEDLPKYIPFFSVKDTRQNFTYEIEKTPQGPVLNIRPIKDKGPWRISLGFENAKNGFEPGYRDFDMMLGVVQASSNDTQQAPPVVMLGDHTRSWSVLQNKIMKDTFEDYSFAKTVRQGYDSCLSMIQWLPDNDGAKLKIKKWEMF